MNAKYELQTYNNPPQIKHSPISRAHLVALIRSASCSAGIVAPTADQADNMATFLDGESIDEIGTFIGGFIRYHVEKDLQEEDDDS